MHVGVIAGGGTAESGGTLGSAEQLAAAGRQAGYDVTVVPLPAPARDDRATWCTQLTSYDVIYPTVAGLEALFEFIGVPYVGSDVTAAALCGDKGLFNDFLVARGYQRLPYVRVNRDEADDSVMGTASLSYPVFVKPARLGASYGITRVDHPAALPQAIATAAEHDVWLVIEAAMPPPYRELEVAGIRGGDLTLSRAAVVDFSSAVGWRDTGSKYSVETQLQALPQSDETGRAARHLTERLVAQAGITGSFRIDFFVSASGGLLVSEANAVPGHGVASTFPRIFEASGVSRPEQFSLAVEAACSVSATSSAAIRF